MTISFVTKLRLPEERGMSAAIIAKVRAYKEIGVQIELIAPTRFQTPEQKKDFWAFYEIPKNLFPFIKLNSIDLPLRNFRHLVMSWTFSFHAFYYLAKNNRPVVHFYHECIELLFLLKLSKLFYNPFVICEVHHTSTDFYGRLLEHLSLNRANLVVVLTKNLSSYCIKRGCKPEQIKIIPEGVRLEDFNFKKTKSQIRKLLKLPQNKFIIGYGGSFVTMGYEKGIPELIKAVKLLQKKIPNIYLLCVGGPKQFVSKYQDLARTQGVSSSTLFLDRVSPKTLYLYFRAFDICALPFPKTYHFSNNMSPLKMFESMASKNPILATNLPTIKEILTNKENAYLVNPNSATALAAGIEFLYRNKKLSKFLAQHAFSDVRKYTWKQRAKLILSSIK